MNCPVNRFGARLPAAAPRAVVTRRRRAIARVLRAGDMQKAFDRLGLRAIGSRPEDFARFVMHDAVAARAIARRVEEHTK